jgi:cytochrome c-type biogenesis protein CcmF
MLGTLGSFLILAAFVASILSGVAFYLAVQRPAEAPTWRRLGRGAWGVVAAGTLIPFALLVYAFATHQYQYAYVYQNSSNDLPAIFTLSATWAGQEGSFLLWIVLNSLIGLALLVWARRPVGGAAEVTRKTFEAPVMALMALGQAFMLSMVVGLRLGPLTIGASPFTTLLEKFPDAPFLQAGGIPADGSGLNDLLQNYWMAIHPPTLFVGFAMMMVPFAFAVAALWTRRYTEWVRPAVPWTLAAVLVLGVGIMMGGYWAYITLSFGGWWAWDPVENSSLVPWLFGVAAVHAMLVQKKSAAGHKSALLLSVASFMFVVYSTFLTRSGILGDVSVHSFVDLGLYNQLLLWIGTMGLLGFGLFAYRYRELPAPARPPATLSREGMIFSGALVLALIGLVVIIGTSAPILGRIFRDNPAAVAIQFYNTWTLPLGIALAALAGLGQLFWWKKMEVEDVNRALLKPLGLSVAATAGVLLFTPFVSATVDAPAQIAASSPDRIEAAILGSGFLGHLRDEPAPAAPPVRVVLRAVRQRGRAAPRGAGQPPHGRGLDGPRGHGALPVRGARLGRVQPPALGRPGANLRGDRDNFIITRGETKHVQGFVFTYTGQEPGPRGRPVYAMDVTDPRGRQFRATTKVYEAPTGQWIQNPHVQKFFEGDIYIATFPSAMMQPVGGSGQAGELVLRRGEAVSLDGGAYALRFVNYDLEPDRTRLDVPEERLEIAVGALLELVDMNTGDARRLAPIYAVLSDGSQHFAQNRVPEWGITVTFAGMQVEDNAVRILVEGADTAPEDWIVVQAYRKPMISLLWLGTIIITLGFGIAVFRRASEQRR